jgi:hypothetical protein
MEPQIITVSPDGRASASPDHHEDLALWKKSLKKVFHELGLTEHPGQTDENGMYRQFVAKFEKELEKKNRSLESTSGAISYLPELPIAVCCKRESERKFSI